MCILVCTEYVHEHTLLYLSEPCFTGFRGARRDANTLHGSGPHRSRGTPMHVCTGMYHADDGLYWFVLVCTRLS